MNKINILFVQSNKFASGLYRIGFIAEELKNDGRFNVSFVGPGSKSEGFLKKIGESDIVVFQLQTDSKIATLIDVCKKAGIMTVMDMDDDLLNVPLWNPSYYALGTKRTELYDSVNGKPMNVAANRKKAKNIKKMLRKVDLITVTGEGLRNTYSKFNKVKILPNSVDLERIKTSRRSRDGFFFGSDKIRIFWQGSATHVADLAMLKSAIITITHKYPQVQWFIWGSLYNDFAKMVGIPSDRVETKETVSMERYYEHLKKIRMDIGICPLINDKFNECKSNVKWLEYSLSGIPSVVSDISTYTNSVIPEGTALVAKTTNDWVKHLSRLIEDSLLRERIAEDAKAQVLQEFNIHRNIKLWADTYVRLHENNKNKI